MPERKQRKSVSKEIYDIVISMFKTGTHQINEIARTVDLSRFTVSRLIKSYESGITFVPVLQKCQTTYREKRSHFSATEQFIFNQIACENSLVQKEIQLKLHDQLNVDVSQSTISRKIKRIGMSRKRLTLIPNERNTSERLDERSIYAAEIALFSFDNLIFLDETGFNQHSRRRYGYSNVNQKAYMTVPANRGTNNSLLCAISKNGPISYKIKLGAYNAENFMEFISNNLVPYFIENPTKILIMDNARFHKTKAVLNLLRENNIPYKFLVPYSPELNPIEEFFSMIKARFNTMRQENPEKSLSDVLHSLLSTENNYSIECENFYANMGKWLEKARRKDPFI